MITALLAQIPLPAIHNVYELVGFIAILIFLFYNTSQTKQLRKGVNGRLEELLHTTRARAHAEGHHAGVTYEQERKRAQLEASRNAIFELANIKPLDTASIPLADTRPGEDQPVK
jgi:hypothetical protein